MKFEVTIDITGVGQFPLAISHQEFCAMTDKVTFIHHVTSNVSLERYLIRLGAYVDSLVITLPTDASRNTVGCAIKGIVQDLLAVDCKQPIDFRQRVEMGENAAVEFIVKELV